MAIEKPHSPACERNQGPILAQLKVHMKAADRVLLEVGSGTGQHAAYMAPELEGIDWYASDVPANLAGIGQWRSEAHCQRIQAPQSFTVGQDDWPTIGAPVDWLYTANTFHIMAAELVVKLIQQAGQQLNQGARFAVYGPFKYEGEFTSDSNRAFDRQLKESDKDRGIRDFEWLDAQFQQAGFDLVSDTDMPANNQLLIYVKIN